MITFTGKHPFRSKPRIDRRRFKAELEAVNSPWASQTDTYYNLISLKGHDPAIWLAIGLREHRLLTDPNAVALKLNTNSWTNARSIQTAGIDGELVTTAELERAGITDREGPYVRYKSVMDSLIDGMGRIDAPGYVYWRNNAVTIDQVLGYWTEDDAAAYIAFVLNKLNEWKGPNTISWLDAPGVPYWPELAGEFGYPPLAPDRGGHEVDLFIIHTTEGHDSFSHLRGPHKSSIHYLSHPNSGAPRAQLLDERLAGWGAGHPLFNMRAIHYEIEAFSAEGFNEDQYRNVARFAADVMRRHPAILADRYHHIGHSEVPDPNNPGRHGGAGGHTDPGPLWEWSRYISYLHEALEGQTHYPNDPNSLYSELTGHYVVNTTTIDKHRINLLDFWREVGGIDVCGHPLGGMRRDDDGIYRQLFENVLIEAWPDGFGPYPGVHYRLGGLGQRFANVSAVA